MKKLLFFVPLALALTSCKKEGIGGSSTIATMAKHHSTPIPYAKVYLKYNAQESPGTDVTAYDDSLTTDAEGHGHFEELEKGDYYVYGVGYDSSITAVVTGGVPVKLKKGEEAETVVPVTEN
jgi:hypothetical protein